MTVEIALVLLILASAMFLFLTEKLRADLVAILVLLALALFGIVSPREALSGFSNQATITVAAMFVLAAGIQNTGALAAVGRLLGKSRSPTMFLITLFAITVISSAFMNNTPVVAVLIPIVISASTEIRMSPTKSLIPLSYMSQMGGVCTLIGTSSNLIVNSVARELGHRGFGMFEFLPLGALCVLAGGFYLLTIGRWMLPDEGAMDIPHAEETGYYVTELRVVPDSRSIGCSVEELNVSATFGAYVLELWRGGERLWSPRSEVLQEQDVLLVRGRWSGLNKLKTALDLEYNSTAAGRISGAEGRRQVMAEVMIAPDSIIIGHRIKALDRRLPRRSSILGIQRRGHVIRRKLDDVRLEVGDILLLLLPEADVASLRHSRNIILVSEWAAPSPKSWRTPYALIVMSLVVGVAAIGWVDISIASVAGALAMVLAGCLDLEDMYASIDGRVLLLMAGLLPLGVAIENTGAAQYIVDYTLGPLGSYGPHVTLAVLYLMTLFLVEMMSHAAAAVLLPPLAISTASLVGADAPPFLIAVTFSCGLSFLTPIGYQTNTMVYGAGGYRFMDFFKVGLPLNLIFWVMGVIFIPIFWPFYV